MFSEPNLTYSASSNRHLGLNEEESEAARLKNMLRESILKVERENMESIRKGALNQKTVPESKTSVASTSQKNISKVSANKSSVFLKKGPISLHAKSPESKKSQENLSSLPTKPVFQTATTSCPFSNVHFLNHFQSSYLSAKPSSKIKCSNEMDDCLSLDPSTDLLPSWKHVPEQLYRKDNNTIPVVQNTRRICKNLTMQSLPSISINGQNTNAKRNILMEEIKEKSHSADNCVKTTILPPREQKHSRENKLGFQMKNIQNNVAQESSIFTDKSIQVSGQPKISVYTQSSNNLSEVTDYKEYIRELVRESLKEFQLESHQRLPTGTKEKESRIVSHNNDCELDSFIGSVAPNICDENCGQNVEVSKETTSTQTGFGTESMVLDKAQMKDFMREFLHEYKRSISVDIPETPLIPRVEMVHRETQTHNQKSGSPQNVSAVSKEVQVSLLPDSHDQASNQVINPPVAHEIERSDKVTDTSDLIMENNSPSALHQPIITPLPSETSTRLEFMIKSIYQHFCESKPEPDVTSQKLSETISHVTTKNTSVQLDPIPTSNKNTHTNEITLANASNQCDPPPTIETKSTFVQSEPLQQKVDSSIQCDQNLKASKDARTQTFESFNVCHHSEHSAETSVSSTPVSDSMFLDDMLSEGEVFLPWNLRLLSNADKSHPQSSSNIATEESSTSDREKDYSLSEGEIPPNYTLPLNLMTTYYDSGSDTGTSSTQPQTTPTPCRSPFDLSPIRPSLSIDPCRCQSSMSEGEVRNIGSPSEGEVTGQFKQTVPKRYSQGTDTAVLGERTQGPRLNVVSSRGLEGSHSGLSTTQLHSSFELSEGEVSIRVPPGGFSAPRELFTVTEEK